MRADNYRVIISGGGTGGHIFPAIAVADALLKESPSSKVLFVGSKWGMEMEIVPSAGYEIVGVPIVGVKRSLSLSNLKVPFLLVGALIQSFKILKQFKPHVVIGMGGYAAFPLIKASAWRSIPYLLQEQNSYAGLVNRLLAPKAEEICVAYPKMERFFPKERITLTGNPIRSNFGDRTRQKKDSSKRKFGFPPEKSLILIVGGSLGAKTLNRAVMEWAKERRESEASILWQYGRGYKEEVDRFIKDNPRSYIKEHPFLNDMESALAAADLVISRGGATTISELSIAGKATIFVPSPNVADNHQYHNANSIVERGGAILIEDSRAVESLLPTAIELVKDKEAIAQLEERIASLAFRDSSAIVASKVLEAAKRGEREDRAEERR
ncbi:MAG: undecaprenyldiphospho-muramoylpentapeptide beta-N-acetylglucosaminyltransferase [Bacteroidales bacterium]